MQRLMPVLLLVTVLAGCFGPPEAPEGATIDTDPALPGLELAAWTEDRGDRLELHAQVVNDHDEGYWYRINCGHPWEIDLVGPDGEPVRFREVLEPAGCAPQHEVMQPKQHVDTLYSWDYRDHDVENDTSTPVAPGTYTWTIRFTLRDVNTTLEASFDVVVEGDDGADDDNDGSDEGADDDGEPSFNGPAGTALEDFVMTMRANGTYDVEATVKNVGDASPTYFRGCLHEWDWRILHEGEAITVEPGGTCAGFQNTTFPPGHDETFTWSWNGMVYDHETETTSPAEAGTYTWEVTFGLQGTGGDVIVGTVEFQVV